MRIFSNYEALGDHVPLKVTHQHHYSDVDAGEGTKGSKKSFGALLNSMLKEVNQLQMKSDELTEKMITSPDEVNIHDVMVASQKALLSLNFVKSIRDRAIRAYQEIMNMR
ncbi:MAG: flagellar hook-basal body complex protein FliE [Spirochaetes bacterium]|nr:flagellar hook-basal body complex protein FliE [Spirochaetota bacterium]